jgi:hypothetical protein
MLYEQKLALEVRAIKRVDVLSLNGPRSRRILEGCVDHMSPAELNLIIAEKNGTIEVRKRRTRNRFIVGPESLDAYGEVRPS